MAPPLLLDFLDPLLLIYGETYIHAHQPPEYLISRMAGPAPHDPCCQAPLGIGRSGTPGPSLYPCLPPRMGATVFVQPLDLVKNRMQLSGEGAKTREYKTSFHALTSILKAEGLRGIYTGYWGHRMGVRVWVGNSRPWPDTTDPFTLQAVSWPTTPGHLHHHSSWHLYCAV